MAMDIKDVSIHHAKRLHLYDDSYKDTRWFHFGVECADVGYHRDGITLFYDEKFGPNEVERAMVEYLERKGYVIHHPDHKA